MSQVVFVRAWPRDAVTGIAALIRMAGGGAALPYYRDGAHSRAGIIKAPRFTASLGYGDSGWTGGVVPAVTAISFRPGDPALIDQMMAGYWRGQSVEVDIGDEYGALARRLTGVVASVAEQDGALAITAADLSHKLAKPLATGTFAGTGGIEGDAIAEGRVKRRSFGRVFNVEGRLLNAAYNIYEFGDPARPLQSCTVLRDKGRAGTLVTLGWQGSIAATLAALQAAEVPEGGGVFAPSIVCAKWWTQPAGPLTADLLGEIGDAYVETVAQIAAAVSSDLSGPAIANLAEAIAMRPAPAGVHVDDAITTGAAVLDEMLAGASLLWVLDPAGTISINEWRWDGPAEAITGIYLGRQAQFAPHKSRKVGYRRNQHQHGDGDIAADILAADVVTGDGGNIEALIADVQTTVDAKRTIFVQPDAPSAAESAENDWWQQTTADRSTVIATYRRVAGSGQLAIGGNRITIGGNPISLCWTPVEDQRIAAALTAAISAADLADSKAGVFTLYSASDPVPDGTGVGDLLIWSYLYPVVISYWSGAAWVDAATYGATAEQAIAIDAMADDDILARGEKSEAIRSYQALIDDWSALDARATTISSASSARAAAAAAKSALDSYLGGLTPAWNDVATDTPISGSAFRTAFGGLATANVALRNAVSVGAPSGTNVGSTPATTVESGAQAGGNAANSDGSIKDGKVDTGSMVTDAVTNISTFSSTLDQNSYQVLDYPIAGSGLARSRDLPQEFAIVKSRSDSVLDVYVEFDLKSDNDIIIRTACGLRGLISKASPGVTAIISDGGRMTYLSESRSFIFEGLAAGSYTIYGSAAVYMGLAGYPTGDGFQYAKISFIRVVEYKR